MTQPSDSVKEAAETEVDTDTKMETDTERTNTREEDEPIPFGFVTVSSSRDEEVGTAAILPRATAGTVEGTPVFVLSGSPDAVETGLELALVGD